MINVRVTFTMLIIIIVYPGIKSLEILRIGQGLTANQSMFR